MTRSVASCCYPGADDRTTACSQSLDQARRRVSRATSGSARTPPTVALLAQLEAGALLAQNVWDFTNRARIQTEIGRDLTKPDDQRFAKEAAARNLAQADASMDGYMRLVRQIATGPARLAIAAQLGSSAAGELRHGRRSTMLPFLPLLQQHAADARGGPADAAGRGQGADYHPNPHRGAGRALSSCQLIPQSPSMTPPKHGFAPRSHLAASAARSRCKSIQLSLGITQSYLAYIATCSSGVDAVSEAVQFAGRQPPADGGPDHA